MRIVLFGGGLFFLALLVHWTVWQFRVPKRQTAALLLILLGILPVGLAVGMILPSSYALGGFWECLHVGMFHVAMSLIYIVIYSALEERSPTLALISYVADAGDNGRGLVELADHIDDALFVDSRLQALVRDNMIVEAAGRYRLTRQGKSWAQGFALWRRLLRMSRGG